MGSDPVPSLQAVRDGVLVGVLPGGYAVVAINADEWIRAGPSRWTPGRKSEVLAECTFQLPDSDTKVRLQAYVRG